MEAKTREKHCTNNYRLEMYRNEYIDYTHTLNVAYNLNIIMGFFSNNYFYAIIILIP